MRLLQQRERLRWLVPPSQAPALVRRKIDRLWAVDAFREQQEAQMRFLLEFTDRAPEIPELARRFAENTLLRTYVRWHPEPLRHREIRGLEWLTTQRDQVRSTVLSFLHHGWYEGLFSSLRNAGAPVTPLLSPLVLSRDTPVGLRQHGRIMADGNGAIQAVGGTDHIQSQLRPGMTMAIASDVPGHTEVTFLGRRVLASYGAALIATRTNSPVVLATNHREGDRDYVQLHPPLEPKDFDQPIDLLQEILHRHGEAVLAWPEVLEIPRARWGIIEG